MPTRCKNYIRIVTGLKLKESRYEFFYKEKIGMENSDSARLASNNCKNEKIRTNFVNG